MSNPTIDFAAYLSDDQKREIAEEMFRDQVKEALATDVKVSNFLYEMTHNIITEALEENIGSGWVEKIIQHVKGGLTDKGVQFYVFRDSDRYSGSKDGPGRKYLTAAVEKHAARIETRVLHAIDGMDDMDLGELFRKALADKLGGVQS